MDVPIGKNDDKRVLRPVMLRVAVWVLCVATVLLALLAAGIGHGDGFLPPHTVDDVLVYFTFIQYPLVMVAMVVYFAYFDRRSTTPRSARISYSFCLAVVAAYNLFMSGYMLYEDISGGTYTLHGDVLLGGPDFPWFAYLLFAPPLLAAVGMLVGVWKGPYNHRLHLTA